MVIAKKIFFAVLILTLGTAFAQEGDWKDYSYSDDGFSLSVPAQAVAKRDTSQAKDGTEIHNYYYTVTADAGYMATVTDFHRKDLNPTTVLQRIKSSTVNTAKGRLISQKPVTLGKAHGVQFEFASREYHGRVRYYFLDGKLFGVMCLVPPGQPLLPGTNRFLGSLHLLQ